eukprot:Phypoly_transcript_17388.p1 GENE.Phypoly_transcript_17388~~Phypoly_transcript_17388.p1  ORF type:complete len:113 (+),score=2.72 Phypoly_transcript_17388:61-399(+)
MVSSQTSFMYTPLVFVVLLVYVTCGLAAHICYHTHPTTPSRANNYVKIHFDAQIDPLQVAADLQFIYVPSSFHEIENQGHWYNFRVPIPGCYSFILFTFLYPLGALEVKSGS